jgi:hypothetical protein
MNFTFLKILLLALLLPAAFCSAQQQAGTLLLLRL